MRKVTSAFKISIDAKIEGPDGYAEWVEGWGDDYDITNRIDACVLGAKMYEGYEPYWTGIQNEPAKPAWITGEPPTKGELAWADFAKRTPHYVVSKSVKTAAWPNTRFVNGIDEIAAMKTQAGKDIYVMGGAQLVCSCLDAGIVDELHLLVSPLIAGPGKPLFATIAKRHDLALRSAEQRPGGLFSAIYDVAPRTVEMLRKQ